MSLSTSFGRLLREARREKHLTQENVAEAVFISVRWYQKLERGAFLPSAKVMLRLILLLDLDIEPLRAECEVHTEPASAC